MLVTCTGHSHCKKSETNGHQDNVLAIIHLENINNSEQLVQTSSWVNIDLVNYQDTKETSDTSFSFSTKSPQDVAKFEVELRGNKRELLIFGEEEEKFTHNRDDKTVIMIPLTGNSNILKTLTKNSGTIEGVM